jgi:23S rRNA (cytosine1962-C5)-methyltransferase
MQRIFLKKGREAPVLRGHPWIFSGAIEKVEGDGEDVAVADIFDSQKTWIARGFLNVK